MLKKTYTLGLLAVATLRCIFTPSAQASQAEINKQTANQNTAAIGHGNTVYQMVQRLVVAMPLFKTLTKAATKSNPVFKYSIEKS